MFNSLHCNHSYDRKANYSLVNLCNHASIMESIGQRIKRMREAAGVTQQYVADKIGVSRVAVTKWESGETSSLKLHNLIGLRDLFKVTVEYLIEGDITGVAKPNFISKREIMIADIVNDLHNPELNEEDIAATKSVLGRIANTKLQKKSTGSKKD